MTSDSESARASATDIGARSEIARFLGKEVWPANRERLLQVAQDNEATDQVLSRLSSLPADATFQNVQEVAEQLGLASPQHDGPGAD